MLTFIKKNWFILLYLAFYFLIINLVVLNRFWQFEAFYFDHGIFDSSLWQAAHFQIPIIDHLEGGFISQFTDHFTPTMYLLTPLYWITSAYEPLLILENFLVVSSALILFLVAKTKIVNRLMVFALILAYTLFIGLQNTIIANFHTELITVLTLSLTLLAIEKKKWFWYGIFLILTLGTKQNFAAIGIGLGIYIFFVNKKIGVFTIAFSLIYYFLITKIVISSYLYAPVFNFSWDSMKTETVFTSLATFGFLPLGAITFLPAIFQDYITRFFFTSSARWDLGMHYNASLSVLLAYGAIVTTSKIKCQTFLAILIIILALGFHQKYHGPLGLAFNKDFYKHTAEMNFLRNLLTKVPDNKTVMTLNNLAPYLTHTNKVMLVKEKYWEFNPEIIVLDIRFGQSPSNHWPGNESLTNKINDQLSKDQNYRIIYQTNEQKIYSL